MMRILIALSLAGALLSGCTWRHPGLVLGPVGPPPVPSENASSHGTLVVFPAFEQGADFNAPDDRRESTDYQVLSADGKRRQTVHNDGGGISEAPKPVELPAGTCRFVARANGYGRVTAPIIIRPNQATTVHLEGAEPDREQAGDSTLVRLPDGAVVG